MNLSASLLIAVVAAVGVLHTAVPDHWVPIALFARQRGWSSRQTALAAARAGFGHVASTLLIGTVVWLAGAAAAARFGYLVENAASLALIAFGLWFAISAWREAAARHQALHGNRNASGQEPAKAPPLEADLLFQPLPTAVPVAMRHIHLHRHGKGPPHMHWHDHDWATAHELSGGAPQHTHRHRNSSPTTLLLILGSSPMVEGIPAFFAAAPYGPGLLALMAVVFAASTIATYVVLCTASAAGLERVRLGPLERFGEMLSGGMIAFVGLIFWVWPLR